MDQQSLLDRVDAGHRAFVERVSGSSAPSLEADDTPPIDLLQHIVVHQERMLAWLEESLQSGHPVEGQPYDMPEPELNALNERILNEGRGRTVGDLLASLDQIHRRVLHFVDSAPDAFLFDAQRWSLRGGEPLWMAVAANTYEHYEEHAHEWR